MPFSTKPLTKNKLEKLDLPKIFDAISHQFPDKIPPEQRLKSFVRGELSGFGLGAGELFALSQLVFSIWMYFFGTNGSATQSKFVCDKMFKGDRCGMQIIKTEQRGEAIYVWCGRGHETIVPILK